MNSRSWVWALLGCVVSMSALADDEKGYNIKSTKSYIALSGGRSSSPNMCYTTVQPDGFCNSRGTIYRIGYGYNITSFWGMEISYGDFARSRETGTYAVPPAGITGGGPVPYIRNWSVIGWELATTATLHLGDHLSLNARGGVLRANLEDDIEVLTTANKVEHIKYRESGNNVTVGGGIQFDFNRDVGLRFEVNRYNKLGNTYKFKTTSALASLILKF